MQGQRKSMTRNFSASSCIALATAVAVLTCSGNAFAARPPEAPSTPPEFDTTAEVIAVPAGGRVVVVQFPATGATTRTDGGRAARFALNNTADAGQGGRPCSQTSRSADERTECENRARLRLQTRSARELTRMQYESALQASRFFFERKDDRSGIANAFVGGISVGIPISTSDELLTRVRLLGVTEDGRATIAAESLSQRAGILRWRSTVTSYDSRGRALDSAIIDGREQDLPHGDYAVANERGELGLLRMSGESISVDWRPLAAASKKAPLAPAPPTALSIDAPEARSTDFDFERFARVSALLDGDDGRATDRPITRAQVLSNIKQYVDARWTMAAANYEQPGLPSECRPTQGRTWQRPVRLQDSVGRDIRALPYKWGGYLSVDQFMTRIAERKLAGSVCACTDPSRNYCIVENAAGIDCSGFVSRVWGVGRHTTASIGSISTPVRWSELLPGDVLNKPRDHVRVFLELVRGTEIGFRIAESSVSCGGVCERVVTARELDGYEPRRYRLIRD